MRREQFEIRKNDLAQSRTTAHDTPALDDGELLARIERFALTANNITYGVVGEEIGYWEFFPVDETWGIIPVWGFAEVIESRHADIGAGERLFGFFPMATHLRLQPAKVSEWRLLDAAPHRADLPAVYNAYSRSDREPGYDPAMDDERMLLFPLYATSYCLYDFLLDNDNFGAEQIVICSASSKTAIGLAYALQNDAAAPSLIALTSPQNLSEVRSLGLYDQAFAYADLAGIDNSVPTTIVDMSGNGAILSNLHAHLADNMRFTSNVGLTHYDANAMGPAYIRDRSAMFFAPDHIKKRAEDWGPGEFEKKAMAFWREAAVKSRRWLRVERVSGMDALERAYREVLSGSSSPAKGIAVSL